MVSNKNSLHSGDTTCAINTNNVVMKNARITAADCEVSIQTLSPVTLILTDVDNP
jgi:hypothetical protein